MILYKIENVKNRKLYIGITSGTLVHRWSQHKHAATDNTRKHSALYAAMRKYGVESFRIEVLENVEDYEELKRREVEAIQEHGSHVSQHGYNLTLGGEGTKGFSRPGYWLGRERSPETKAKLREAHTGKVLSPEIIAKISRALSGRKLSDQHKRLLSEGKMGARNPQYGLAVPTERRLRISEAMSGRRLSQKTKDILSSARRGEKSSSAILAEDQVRAIKTGLLSGVPGKQLASDYSVSAQTISAIKSGRRWSHVE